MNSSELINLSSILEMESLNRRTISEAAKLLTSENPKDRQTAAIHLGQLKAHEHLQEIKQPLNDNAYFTRITQNNTNKVYYVKEAAEKAIELAGEDHRGSFIYRFSISRKYLSTSTFTFANHSHSDGKRIPSADFYSFNLGAFLNKNKTSEQ